MVSHEDPQTTPISRVVGDSFLTENESFVSNVELEDRWEVKIPEYTQEDPGPPVQVTLQRGSASEQATRCVGIAENALNLFLEKNKGYGDTGYILGARGQYADMNRKMGKLKHTLWDGNIPVGESNEEMLMDLIGHALLTIDYLRSEL